MKFNIDEKIKRYIKLKRSFMFREALIITGASKDYLEASLDRLIMKEELKLEKSDGSLLNRVYKVIKEQDKKDDKPYNGDFIRAVAHVCKELKKEQLESVDFLKLFNLADLEKKQFERLLESFEFLEIIKTPKPNYKIDLSKIDELLTFYKQKKFKELQEILDGKRPIRYVEVPKVLPNLLNVIIENEVLKRDELAKLAKVTRKQLTDWWQMLKKLGIVIDSYKETPTDRVTYIFSSKRARTVLAHINNGAWERDKELKKLWTH